MGRRRDPELALLCIFRCVDAKFLSSGGRLKKVYSVFAAWKVVLLIDRSAPQNRANFFQSRRIYLFFSSTYAIPCKPMLYA
jgi:hypothetical protein